MLDVTMKNYNEIVDMVESCCENILEVIDFKNSDYDDKFQYINQRLYIFSLEVLSKFSH